MGKKECEESCAGDKRLSRMKRLAEEEGFFDCASRPGSGRGKAVGTLRSGRHSLVGSVSQALFLIEQKILVILVVLLADVFLQVPLGMEL